MDNPRVVDLRSDTVTKPTPEMRRAMMDATVGDDVFKEDPTVNELECAVAELLGKEAALLMPSGTMGNLASVMAHCDQRGQEMLVGDSSHMFLNEGGAAQVASVHSWAVPTQKDGRLLIQDLESRVRYRDTPCPRTALLCLEDTHNLSGGTVLSVDYLEQASRFAKSHKIPLHMDGARILNAATYLGLPAKDILRGCDSVMLCISKGLACPVGSLVAGTKDFIYKLVRTRMCLGGAMCQSGILAAAGLVSLKTILPRLHEDHDNTQRLVRGVSLRDNLCVGIDLATVQTNIAVYDFHDPCRLSPQTFCERLNKVTQREFEDLQQAVAVKMRAVSPTKVRAVLHNDVGADDVEAAVAKIRYVIEELCRPGED
uniref:Putative threonine aldolase n=1 Tax=Rhipicephalus pulchellus TaxID=72859 RepID=L7M2K3_RHIPC